MAWRKAMLHLRVSLAVAMMFLVSHSRADDICIWCDPEMSRVFLDCFYVNIQRSSDFGNLPSSSMDDMKNSILAAAGAMTNTPDSLKKSIMNGAMAGELAELINAQSVSQDREVLVKIILGIVGNCYFEISGQSHHRFTGMIGNAVDSMLQANADSGGQPSSPTLPQPSRFSPVTGGQNLHNNDASLQQQQTLVENQATSNAASQNYQGKPLNRFLLYPNAVQNYQAPLTNIQSNAQMYSMNNQQNIPPRQNSGGGPYPLNQQNEWMFYPPDAGLQPGIPNVNLNNNQNGVMPNNAAPLLQSNQLPVENYGQNSQLYPIPNQNDPPRVMYPGNQAPISTIQTDDTDDAVDDLNTAPQSNLNTLPVVSKIPSSVLQAVPSSPAITTDNEENIKPQPNTQPKTKKPKRKSKRRRTKTPSHKVTPAPGHNVKNVNRSNDDKESAIKFAETIYFILRKSNIFPRVFNEDLSNNDAVSITFNIIQNALNDCGYSKFSLDIANACVVSFPVQCASEIYAEAIAKSLMTQFYKIGLIGRKPVDQGSSLAISILKQLKQALLSVDSDSAILPTDSSTDSTMTTTLSSNDASVVTQDSSDSDSITPDINTQFYNALYASLCKSFRSIFNKQATKSDVISCAVQMLTSLSADYGKQIMITIARKCAKSLATLPDDCPLELFATVICNCITNVLSYNGLISQATPADQAKNIASKFNTALIKIINKESDNIPVDDSAPQNIGNVPLDNLQLQNATNVPIVNSMPQNTANGQIIPQASQNILDSNKQLDTVVYGDNNNPYGDKSFMLQKHRQTILKQDSFTNTNLNADISNQNNGSPANLVVKDINFDNTPDAQIFPDDDSDESKQRIRILMKWAISSMENGKFNYKIFSGVISALAKHLQTTHPDLRAQKALFKVLLESIVACTQLLMQAPPSTIAIQNAHNTNGPNLLNTNVGDITNANVPLLQNANTPLSQNENTPLLQNNNVPPSQNINTNIPNSQNVNNIPILQNAYTPLNLPFRSQDVVQSNLNYPEAQQNNYNNGQQGNANVFATGLNNYAVQQGPLYNNQPPQQIDGIAPGQDYFDAQQQTVTNWNNGYVTGQRNQNSFLSEQNNYAFQQELAPGQGTLVSSGQSNFPASQAALGIPDANANLNGASYGFQGEMNYPYLNQQYDGSFPAGNPNQNVFSQNLNRASYEFQDGMNNPYLNQQYDGSFLAGNPNQNVFPQNLNGASYGFQGGMNDPYFNQQYDGSFPAGNPNQNVFPQNNMQGGYQNNWN